MFENKMNPNIGGDSFACEPLPETEQKDMATIRLTRKNSTFLTVPYVSVWDGGIEVTTTADVNIRTGEVNNIAVADVSGLDTCEREYIVMNDEQVDVYADEHGYEHWADIKGVYDSMFDNTETMTQCVNGILKRGDLVLSTPDEDYACLIGRVGDINLVGSPEHDAETENETDDVHVNFMEFDYSDKRIAEIEEMFSDLYGTPKEFGDCSLDDTIMSPDCLIRITGIDDDALKALLESGFNAACYCYNMLAKLMEPAEQPHSVVNAEDSASLDGPSAGSDKIKEELFNTIDTAVALAGFKVLEGDRDCVMVRHRESDTIFEIKVGEIPF